jgi:hypothetical protein
MNEKNQKITSAITIETAQIPNINRHVTHEP